MWNCWHRLSIALISWPDVPHGWDTPLLFVIISVIGRLWFSKSTSTYLIIIIGQEVGRIMDDVIYKAEDVVFSNNGPTVIGELPQNRNTFSMISYNADSFKRSSISKKSVTTFEKSLRAFLWSPASPTCTSIPGH